MKKIPDIVELVFNLINNLTVGSTVVIKNAEETVVLLDGELVTEASDTELDHFDQYMATPRCDLSPLSQNSELSDCVAELQEALEEFVGETETPLFLMIETDDRETFLFVEGQAEEDPVITRKRAFDLYEEEVSVLS